MAANRARCAAVHIHQHLPPSRKPYKLQFPNGHLQRLYREIAMEQLPNCFEYPDKIQDCLVAALRRRVTGGAALSTLSPQDRQSILALAWNVLSKASRSDASVGASAATALIGERLAGWDYRGAGALALDLVDTTRARLDINLCLPAEDWWRVISALRSISDWPRIQYAAEQMLRMADTKDDVEARRMKYVSMGLLAEALACDARSPADVARSEELFSEALVFSRALAHELYTPEVRRDLSVSLNNLANAALRRGDEAAAVQSFTESLELNRIRAADFGTPEARRDVSVSLNYVAKLTKDRALSEQLVLESLQLRRNLEEELKTPEARRDVSLSLSLVAAAARDRGDSMVAECFFTECLAISRALADEFDTPESKRDLVISISDVAEAARVRGDLGYAERLLTECLESTRALERDLGTREAKRDLAVSLDKVADTAFARLDFAAAESLFSESLGISLELEYEISSPEASRDVAISRNNVAKVARAREQLRISQSSTNKLGEGKP